MVLLFLMSALALEPATLHPMVDGSFSVATQGRVALVMPEVGVGVEVQVPLSESFRVWVRPEVRFGAMANPKHADGVLSGGAVTGLRYGMGHAGVILASTRIDAGRPILRWGAEVGLVPIDHLVFAFRVESWAFDNSSALTSAGFGVGAKL